MNNGTRGKLSGNKTPLDGLFWNATEGLKRFVFNWSGRGELNSGLLDPQSLKGVF
jgi:hypothetical protein